MKFSAESIGKLLREIQESDDARKKRWLIASSCVAAVFVFALWLANINFMISSQREQAANTTETSQSLLSKIGSGFSYLGHSAWDGTGYLRNIIGTPREDIIK